MATNPTITEEMLAFLKEYHLASLTTLRKDGSPHVVPVGFSYDPTMHVVRIITFPSSVKYKNALRGGRAVVSQRLLLMDMPHGIDNRKNVKIASQ